MGNLKNLVCYLSGPIDFAQDDGKGWRDEVIEKTRHLGIKYFDPCHKGVDLSEIGSEKNKAKALREAGQYDDLTKFSKKIRRADLRHVDLSDFAIVYLDLSVTMMGTFDELHIAERQQKPLFIIVKQGKNKAPLWLYAAVDHNYIFSSIDEMIAKLEELDKADALPERRWIPRWQLRS